MEKQDELKLSRLAHGHWRLAQWNFSPRELLYLTNQCFDLGITTFDHADIYGDYTCEQLFGKALTYDQTLREKIQLITKCGIKLLSNKFPGRKIKHYDYSASHIRESVHQSLKNFNTDYIDLLLLHRPAPFINPEEVAVAFDYLYQSGKVLHFGVSNFTPDQFRMLQSYVNQKLVTNQVEISALCLEHFGNGNMDFFLKERIKPMAWSALGGGKLLQPETAREKRLNKTLTEIAREKDVDGIDKIALSWLFMHPTGIIPVLGTGKISRVKRANEAAHIKLSTEEWYRVYTASLGEEVP